MKQLKPKTLRLSAENCEIRNDDQEPSKMIIEGYPIVFGKETLIFDGKKEFYESIDRHAFDNCDMSDVCLKYNHNDNKYIMARTKHPKDKPQTLYLTIDDHGVFMRAELIDTSENIDAYKMVKSGLITEGSFAFVIDDFTKFIDADGMEHRNITSISVMFDVAICPNGAYGDLTEIYARSYDWLENQSISKVETLKRCNIIRLRNKNKIKLMEVKEC